MMLTEEGNDTILDVPANPNEALFEPERTYGVGPVLTPNASTTVLMSWATCIQMRIARMVVERLTYKEGTLA